MDTRLPHTTILRDMLRTETMILAQDHSHAQQQHRRHHHSDNYQYLFHSVQFGAQCPFRLQRYNFFFIYASARVHFYKKKARDAKNDKIFHFQFSIFKYYDYLCTRFCIFKYIVQ